MIQLRSLFLPSFPKKKKALRQIGVDNLYRQKIAIVESEQMF
jgi:hypothetical protein